MSRCRFSRLTLVGCILLAVLTAGVGMLSGFRGPVPGAAKAVETLSYDLDRDGIMENYWLDDGRLTVSASGQEDWCSPAGWRVTGFNLADATNDGRDDLLLVVWKRGSFGRDKPFWYSGQDDEYSNHLFVYDRIQGKLRQVWCSSALDRPILELAVTDVDQDGKNELAVREQGGNQTTWLWRGWGFYQVEGPNQD